MLFVKEDEYLKELKSTTEYTGVHPKKFALWLGIASMTMFFAALTSALILKKGDYKVWENFRLPDAFLYSTIVIVLVSVSMHFSLVAYKNTKFAAFRALLTLGFLLALLFLFLQYLGWIALISIGKPLTGNISGQFIYLISSLHAVHIVAGLIVTLFFLIFSFRARKDVLFELKNIVNPRRLLHMELLVTFWHFIDIVWIYLYLFFYYNYI
jgi:cytochrome c oxidase subunit 3